MTEQELTEYNKLSDLGKEFYQIGMREHPNWTHKQALTYAVICTSGMGPVEKINGTGDPEPSTPQEIFADVVKKAQVFMSEEFPRIYALVRDTFTTIITRIKDGIIKTWNEIINFFK